MEGLREHGYLPGQNLLIECRWDEGREERDPALAAELLSLKPDLIVAIGHASALAAKVTTGTIPIVMVNVTEPVGRGLVGSLAHPGGNVTGLTSTAVEIAGKRLQLLKEAVPKLSRVAVLGYTGVPAPGALREREAAAQALHLTLQYYRVQAPEELEAAFAAMTKARAEALVVETWPFTFTYGQRIAALAAHNRLPALHGFREAVQLGGLMAYDVILPAMFRRAADYVDKILKGAKPADLPVEQPTKFDLIINLKAAKAIGLTIPQSLLMRADEVIQ